MFLVWGKKGEVTQGRAGAAVREQGEKKEVVEEAEEEEEEEKVKAEEDWILTPNQCFG